MIPTPERIRADRVVSGVVACVAAAAVAAALGAVARLLWPGAAWLAVAGATGLASFVAALLVYRRGTQRIRRRLAVLARPFPLAWRDVLEQRVAFYVALGATERERFEKLLAVFLDETPITPGGCEVDETVRVLVGASAIIPIFGFPQWEYGMLREVVVRPGVFEASYRPRDLHLPAIGLAGNIGGPFNGILVFSRRDLLRSFRIPPSKHNVGIHEFAHLIDKADGGIDGIPAGLPRDALGAWQEVIRDELERGAEQHSDIPEYGFTNEEEFFAVASEYFFGRPEELWHNHPRLYGLLEQVYRQDMRGRPEGLSRRRGGGGAGE